MACLATRRQFPTARSEEPWAGNYFVAAYPPFSRWQPSQTDAVKEALREAGADEPLGIYVHIPFCHKKCDYCYYLSYVGAGFGAVTQYVENVIREMDLYGRCPAVRGRPISFVYIGGGTPSTLSSYQARCLLVGLKRVLPWNGVKEVTWECAPRSVRREFLDNLRDLGVTRLSMGAQSFDNNLLKLNGRIHLMEDVLRAYGVIQQVGFDWINLDLMVGLIGETEESWRESIRRVIELSPDSVTIYQTEIPYNTQLYDDLKSGHLTAPPISWDVKRQRLDDAFCELEYAGYTVVNGYAAVKDPERHRLQYQEYLWRGGDMLGLGVASFSYFRGVHFQNQVTLATYQAQVQQECLPLNRAFRLTHWDRLVREFILQLKFGEVSAEAFRKKFSVDITKIFLEPLQTLAEEGFATYSEAGVRLTREGLLRVDRLLPRFYDPELREVRYT